MKMFLDSFFLFSSSNPFRGFSFTLQEMKGVVAFYSAKDIPGKNAFVSAANQHLLLNEDELVRDVYYLPTIFTFARRIALPQRAQVVNSISNFRS